MLTMLNTITCRVRRGAVLLDQEQPDWFEEIDTRTLDVRYTEVCPLGQLYGSYEDGLDALHLHLPWRYGFIRSPFSMLLRKANSTGAIADYAMLNAAWRAEILARRQANAAGLWIVGNRCRSRNVSVAANHLPGEC
jgi:hypothetical protein